MDYLIIDGLRYRPHSTHFNIEQALAVADAVDPKRTFFTHLCHDVEHAQLENRLKEKSDILYSPLRAEPAYDGLVFELYHPV